MPSNHGWRRPEAAVENIHIMQMSVNTSTETTSSYEVSLVLLQVFFFPVASCELSCVGLEAFRGDEGARRPSVAVKERRGVATSSQEVLT